MEIKDILEKACKFVNDANISDEFKAIAFEKSVDFLLRTGGMVIPAQTTETSATHGLADISSEKPLQYIAERLKVGTNQVKEVYDYDETNGLTPVVPVGKLDASKASATREIALLVAGGRQIAGIEEWTGVRSIREVCEHYGKYDSANFASSVKRMQEVFSFKGTGQKRQVRINKVGEEELRGFLQQVTGGAS